ncbi:MAG: hypothetical protein ACREVS_08625 [Burkholderiales bacterium]
MFDTGSGSLAPFVRQRTKRAGELRWDGNLPAKRPPPRGERRGDRRDYGALMQQSDIGMHRAKGRSSASLRLEPATSSQPSPGGIE